MTNTRTANMALAFSDEQGMILESAKSFCRDQSGMTAVRGLLSSESGYNPEVWAEMVALGWTGIAIAEQYGGSALGIGSTIPLVESMGRHLLSTPYISTTIASQTLQRGGSEEQKSAWLPRMVEGTVATLALLDNEDWGATTTSCTLSAEFELRGTKLLVNDGAVADLFIVLANHNGAQVLVLVEAADLPAEALSKKVLIDETKRACNVCFDGIKLSADAILPNSESALRDSRLIGALLTAAEATGSSAAALDVVVAYLTSRIQFGRLIGSYQSLKHPTVEMLIGMDSARTLIYHAATIVGDEALDQDAEIACRMAKAQATDALLFAGDRGIQFHGGMGFTYECDAQLYLRRALWMQHQYGDAQHHRLHLANLLLN
ncbi:MAG: acyl-CoA/acyl-ACP dehydrogenase [Porticoccaceae bacterium]|nr:acyl-CoA/acyl-ACP dehydrogenase [Porticoccaceae bacterium]